MELHTAEPKFEELIQENPDEPSTYVVWSDLYWLGKSSPKDYQRGEAILQRALQRPHLEDRDFVLERLEELCAERGTPPPRRRHKR